MGKSKNQTETVVVPGANPVPATPAGQLFKRKAAVNLPVLKLEEGKPVFVHVTGPIIEKMAPVKGEDGVERMKTILLCPVVELETGEIMQIVTGVNLAQTLRDYKGGNQAYVGLSFEITKLKSAPGKKWKPYSVFEVEAGE